MLGLKSSTFLTTSLSRTGVLDLPPEVIDLVFHTLYNDCFRRVDSIIPASRACRLFRASALPLMFEYMSCVIRQDHGQFGPWALSGMLGFPHLLTHVKTLYVRDPVQWEEENRRLSGGPSTAEEDRLHDLDVLERALKQMPLLHCISFRGGLVTAIDVLSFLPPNPGLIVVFDAVRHLSVGEELESLLDQFRTLSCQRVLAFRGIDPLVAPGSSWDIYKCKELATLERVVALVLPTFEKSNLFHLYGVDSILQAMNTVEELSLSIHCKPAAAHIIWDKAMDRVPWASLRRLSIVSHQEGSSAEMLFQAYLNPVISKLKSLEMLRLLSITQQLTGYHVNCPYVALPPIQYTGQPYLELDFTSMPRLQVLEVEDICDHVPIRGLVGPNLRALKLHSKAVGYRRVPAQCQRSVADLVLAAKLAPQLERLELDIGYIENLWNPTAIPGVDVDMEQYQFLDALCKFSKLKFLRLFPPFLAKMDAELIGLRNAERREPVSDEQAVRMFQYLRNRGVLLEVFSISAPVGLGATRGINTLTWEVRPWGEKTLLTTRPSGQSLRPGAKHYEVRQIWVGGRRLTMSVKRHSYQKPYLADSEGWFLSAKYGYS